MFDAVLIANRGEIAIRIARACRELGVRSVAVYSEADRDAPHVTACDDAYLVGPAAPAASYLAVDRLLEVASRAGVQAVHPGYGFLAENASFAQAVQDAGLVFVGPSPAAIAAMGDKLSARAVAAAAGVPVVPGTDRPTDDPAVAAAFAAAHGYPVAVKAMFGGGGRGLKVARTPGELEQALVTAAREAETAFGRGECYLERYLERPRHVEVQVLADTHGHTVHLGDRDCSLQRRHQKLLEEAPAPGLAPAVRDAMADAAIRIAREMGYVNAGTCEFLLDEDGERFYFLEMNTRLQVEHPVTELLTGVDLVQAQLRIAAGEALDLEQEQVQPRGHAIEVRINAEDPAQGFLPVAGRVTALSVPAGPWVRFDGGVTAGSSVPQEYDSLLGKLVVWAADRDACRARMLRALDELVVEGVPTTAGFHRLALAHPAFARAEHATSSVESEWDLSALEAADVQQPPTGTAPDDPGRLVTVEVEGRRIPVRLFGLVPTPAPAARRARVGTTDRHVVRPGGANGELLAPMQGTVVEVIVTEGDRVEGGAPLLVLEAMKMENTVRAPTDGTVAALPVTAGSVVQAGTLLARIDPD